MGGEGYARHVAAVLDSALSDALERFRATHATSRIPRRSPSGISIRLVGLVVESMDGTMLNGSEVGRKSYPRPQKIDNGVLIPRRSRNAKIGDAVQVLWFRAELL